MENNEIMNEGIEMVEDVVVVKTPGIGIGAGLLIGAGVIVAVCATVKLAKKAYDAHKAKKELRQPDEEIEVDPEDLVEVK